jgi:hypothetical protein
MGWREGGDCDGADLGARFVDGVSGWGVWLAGG